MTKLSYNVINGTNNTVFTGIKTYPQAVAKATEVRGQVVSVYTPTELKEEYPLPKDRLVARLG